MDTATLLGYARVSRRDQDPTPQIDQLHAAGASQVYVDQVSGVLRRRPGLERLLAAAVPGDAIAVTRVDRLGRSLRDLLALVDDLDHRELAIYALAQGIDTRTATGRTMLMLFGILAESERAWLIERTHAGLDTARAAGRRGGRPTVITEAKLRAARQLLDDGESLANTATAIGVGRSTLHRHLQGTPPVAGVPAASEVL